MYRGTSTREHPHIYRGTLSMDREHLLIYGGTPSHLQGGIFTSTGEHLTFTFWGFTDVVDLQIYCFTNCNQQF